MQLKLVAGGAAGGELGGLLGHVGVVRLDFA